MTDRTNDDVVRRIADRVAAGDYEVDAIEVADAVIARWAMEDVVARFERYSAETDTEDDSSSP